MLILWMVIPIPLPSKLANTIGDAEVGEPSDDRRGRGFRRRRAGLDRDFRIERALVGGVDAGEILEFAQPRLPVEALGIALFGDRERRVDEHLDELARLEQVARHAALQLER